MNMENQNSDGAGTTQSGEATQPDAGAVGATDWEARVASLEKDLADARAHKDKAVSEIGKYRDRMRDEESARQRALEENQQYKGLAESLKAERDTLKAELESAKGLAEKAAAWDKFEESQRQVVAGRLDSVPSYIKVAIEATSDVGAQMRILQEFDANNNQPPVTKPANGGGSPPTNGPREITEEEFRSGNATEEERANWLRSVVSASKRVGKAKNSLL